MQTVSVIVPVYNIARDLPRCVESILNQTYKDLELILVDDGSTDGSGELCDSYAQDARVKVIHQKNAGVSAARNAGLDAATGEYLTFVDSDDYVEPALYEKMAAAMEQEQLDIAACGVFYDDTPVHSFPSFGVHPVEPQDAIRDVISDNLHSVFWAAVWNKLYRAALKPQLHFDSRILMAEDMLVTLQCLTAAGRIGAVDYTGYHYVQRAGSMVHTYKKNKCSSALAHMRMEQLLAGDPRLTAMLRTRSLRQSSNLLMEQILGENYYPEDVAVLLDEVRRCADCMEQADLPAKERLLLQLSRMGFAPMLHRLYRLRH